MNWLGLTLLKQGKWSEAEPILRVCSIVLKKTAPDAIGTFVARSQLGESLLGQGRYAEAEPLIVSGYEGLEARVAMIPRANKARLAEAVDRVVRLYERSGRPEKARAWRARLGSVRSDAMMPNGIDAFAH